MTRAEIRELTRAEIEPHIPALIADGFTPEIDQGTWLGAFVDGTLAGFVRVFQEGGAWMLEDVMVFEQFRRRGLAAELIRHARERLDHLWLICDDPMIGYYEGLGFGVAPKPDFPEPLATLYTAKGMADGQRPQPQRDALAGPGSEPGTNRAGSEQLKQNQVRIRPR